MMYETIVVDRDRNVTTIAFNKPESLNAVDEQMVLEVANALEAIMTDDQTKVVVLTGLGEAFCSQGQLKPENDYNPEPHKIPRARQKYACLCSLVQRVTRTIYQLDKPTIAMVNGVANGPGLDWALACDLRIGSSCAQFACGAEDPSLIPQKGAMWLYFSHLGIGRTYELLYSGSSLDAHEAFRIGILNRLVSPELLQGETIALARKISQAPLSTLRLTKLRVRSVLKADLDADADLIRQVELMASTYVDGYS